THGNPGHDSIAEMFSRLFEVNCCGGNEARHHAIGESGDEIRLECQSWNVLQDCRQHRRSLCLSADVDHIIRFILDDHSGSRVNYAPKIEQGSQPGGQVYSIESSNSDQ